MMCSLIRVDLEEGDLLDLAVRKRFMMFWLHIISKASRRSRREIHGWFQETDDSFTRFLCHGETDTRNSMYLFCGVHV